MSTDSPALLRFLRGPWLLAALFFVASLLLFTRNNTFPFDYHPDEDGKAYQLIHRERNYHHPLLMLNATDLAVLLSGTPRTSQAVVVTGRWVSAAFAAGAVALLVVLGVRRGGWPAAAVLGVLTAGHEALFQAAHFLKEDTALVFGIALFLLAADYFVRRPSAGTLRFLAIGAAVATSGKYIGVLALAFALPLVWRTGAALGAGRWKHFSLIFLGVFVLLNVPPTTHASSPFKSLKREVGGVTEGHRGLQRDVPHAKYVSVLRGDVPAPLLWLAGLHVAALLATARRRTGAEWSVALLPIVYFAILSCSPKTAGRYLLPASTLACVMAGLGLVDVARLLTLRAGKAAAAATALLVLGGGTALARAQLPLLQTTMKDFTLDDRIALAAWIRQHVPAGAILVEDGRVNLEAPAPGDESGKPRVPQHVYSADFAADFGPLETLRSWGQVYVVVSPKTYDRFFSSSLKPGAKEKALFDWRKAFYAELFAQGELMLKLPSRGIVYLQPGLLLYRLPPRDGANPGS